MLYLAVAIRAFRRAATYRTAYVAGILTNAFFGSLVCFVYQALYADGGTIGGFSLADAISYAWFTQALISIGAGWISSTDLALAIRSGDVVSDLMRPWNFQLYWLSRSLGERLFNLLLRGSLTYLIGVLYFAARIPTWADLLAFAPAIVFSLLVSFGFGYCINLSAFWLIDNNGLISLSNVILGFFSGFLLPLAFFPAWLQTIAGALPFQAITSVPTLIFLGKIAAVDLPATLLGQLGWALVLLALGALIQAAAMRKVVVQGG